MQEHDLLVTPGCFHREELSKPNYSGLSSAGLRHDSALKVIALLYQALECVDILLLVKRGLVEVEVLPEHD